MTPNTLNFPRPPGAVPFAEFTRDGYRAMTGEEADRLSWGEMVTILNSSTGDHSKGTVHSQTRDSVKVDNRQGAEFLFDLDKPDFWADDRTGERKPPSCEIDGQLLVLVTTALYVEKAEEEPTPLFNAIKASVELVALRKRVAALEAQVKLQADALMGLPSLDEHRALINDVHELHQLVNAALSLRVA